MARYTITAPVATFRGDLAGLVFRDGAAEADSERDRAALDYCRRRGYTVEPLDAPAESGEVEAEVEEGGSGGPIRPRSSDPKADWVTYAISQGADADDAENATKAELVELYGK